ncbi:MAG: hypothetical protein U0989_08285 [Azonexus sp.]|nr:hypothetical protein [Azonexus sp.]
MNDLNYIHHKLENHGDLIAKERFENAMVKSELSMFFKRNAIRVFVVFCVGIMCAYFTDAELSEDWPVAGSLAVALYLLLALGFWIIHAVSRIIYIELFFETDMISRFLLLMQRANLPPPKRHHPKGREYLKRLADDEHAVTADRLKAAMALASIEATKSTMGRHEKQAYDRAIDLAVAQYYQENPSDDKESWNS